MELTKEAKLVEEFTKSLPGDQSRSNSPRMVKEACYSFVETKNPVNPVLIHSSSKLKSELGLDELEEELFRDLMTGKRSFEEFKSYAMCYGGHQFGHWAGQLGDGRAINIARIKTVDNKYTLQLKGSGPTPYSRRADGLAVLRSSIREYLCSEAMFHLGIPTTRALSLSLSGEKVMRDIMYNGNPKLELGAIVCRVAPSFLRFGSYEIHSARRDNTTLKTLLNYTIINHFPDLINADKLTKETYIAFYKEVAVRTKEMILNWQRVGFVHGVMNTDNMSILGLTIDYGPYGWLEDYDPGWTPNTTDIQEKRYRYGNQAPIALWNLTKLANALYPLIEEAAPLEKILLDYRDTYQLDYMVMMLSKIGIATLEKEDVDLVKNLETQLELSEIDMTLFFRNLSQFDQSDPSAFISIIRSSSYLSEEMLAPRIASWESWLNNYADRLKKEETPDNIRVDRMNRVNPKYVLRNYMAQLAIDEADKSNYDLLNELVDLLQHPYDEQPNSERWFAKRPDWAKDKIGCSMLSCSS